MKIKVQVNLSQQNYCPMPLSWIICSELVCRWITCLSVSCKVPMFSILGFSAKHLVNKTENTFSLQSVSQVLQYTNFPSIRVHKFPKVQDTQLVQCPSHLSCPMSKFPKLSKPKLLKAEVTQS